MTTWHSREGALQENYCVRPCTGTMEQATVSHAAFRRRPGNAASPDSRDNDKAKPTMGRLRRVQHHEGNQSISAKCFGWSSRLGAPPRNAPH